MVAELAGLCPIALRGVVLASPRMPILWIPDFKPGVTIVLPLAKIIIVFPAASPRIIAVADAIFRSRRTSTGLITFHNSKTETCPWALVQKPLRLIRG